MTQANKANILTGHVGDHKANRPIRGIRIVHELIENGTASPRGLLVCSGLLQRSMLRGQLFPLVGGAGMRRRHFPISTVAAARGSIRKVLGFQCSR